VNDGASAARQVDILALTFLILRVRLLSAWHRVRVHGRVGWLVPLIALVTPLSYVGLMSQALWELHRRATISLPDADQLAVTLMVVAVIAASFANRLAGGLSLLATVPENELFLARPVSLSRLAVARVLASTLADPVGALFLLPLWTAPILVWGLSGWALLLSVAVSVLVQITITGCAQLADLLLSRWVRPHHRARFAVALRLVATAALALLWIAGTQVLRAPQEFMSHALALRPWLGVGPAHWPTAALLAWRHGNTSGVFMAMLGLALAAAAALAATSSAAKLVSRQGWEEPAPVWTPRVSAEPGAILTPWRRELRLLARDRGRLALIFLVPATFLAVPLLTSQGWAWTSASPSRIAMLVFSMLVYLAASGPLLHMQGEQRAFWILQTVPVSLARLFAMKAAVWSALFVLISSSSFLVLVLAAGGGSTGSLVGTSALLVGGSVGLAFLAVGLGATAVDLTEPARPALGPASFYAFLFVAGLYNVALAEQASVALRGAVMFAVATAATWHSGLARARWAHDPEEVRRQEPRASDAALLAMVVFLAPFATERLPIAAVEVFTTLLHGGVLWMGLRLLWHWRASLRPARGVVWVVCAAALGAGLSRCFAVSPPGEVVSNGVLPTWVPVVLAIAAREVCLRGVVQGAAEHLTRAAAASKKAPRWTAFAVGVGVSVSLELLIAREHSWSPVALGLTAAVIRAATGRVAAATAFRCALVLSGLLG